MNRRDALVAEKDTRRLGCVQPAYGFQDRSADNVIESIAASRERPFGRVLFGLGIPHVGGVNAQLTGGTASGVFVAGGSTDFSQNPVAINAAGTYRNFKSKNHTRINRLLVWL